MSTDSRDHLPYEPPALEQREPLSGLLMPAPPSDKPDVRPDSETTFSDVRVKEHIRPVRW